MRRRSIGAVVAALMVVALGATAAIAVEQTNGTGKTHNGATIGFNAKLDLKGQITYVTHDGTKWWVQCDEITSYRNLKPSPSGALRTKVTAECEDKDGTTLWAEFYFIDRGEPGDRDVIRAFFTYNAAYALDANADPAVWDTECNTGVEITEGCNDRGIIQKGNVQIHQDADLVETLVTRK
jgi:hypothetical protein